MWMSDTELRGFLTDAVRLARHTDRDEEAIVRTVMGEDEPGERLLADAQYMEPEAAESVARWVASWREMSRDEFAECAKHL